MAGSESVSRLINSRCTGANGIGNARTEAYSTQKIPAIFPDSRNCIAFRIFRYTFRPFATALIMVAKLSSVRHGSCILGYFRSHHSHGHTDICLFQCRGIVYAISCHSHDLSPALPRLPRSGFCAPAIPGHKPQPMTAFCPVPHLSSDPAPVPSPPDLPVPRFRAFSLPQMR